jgi:hypothetical protein
MVTAKAKQANKHDDEQDDVGNSHGDDGRGIARGGISQTGEQGWYPFRAQLQMK